MYSLNRIMIKLHGSYLLRIAASLLLAAVLFSCEQPEPRDVRLLVFTKTEGYRHQSIETGVETLRELGAENDFSIVHTEDASKFTDDYLDDFSAIVFLSTTLDVLDPAQQSAMERYIQAGGGFVGIHAAADTEYEWAWYGKLVGGYFQSHPPGTPTATIKLVDGSHISTDMLPESWERTDEWYNYKQFNEDVNVLLELDESTYEGGNMGDFHPIAWYHEYDGGRAWYTGLGHTEETFAEPLFREHLLGGIQFAVGDNQQLAYEMASSQLYPDTTRFTKTVLASNLDEPMELDMLPDGRILFVERKGAIKMFTPALNHLSLVTQLPVWTEEEDGLLGIAVDPNYAENHWIYLMYSDPDPDSWEQHVSRFVFRDDSLHYGTEKILLRVPVQRETCCHSGGSLEFGPDGNLYISTGDDTNPFASDGFAPIDERPGRSSWDAQRSSANTNDLRGKILRIHPEPDGTYTIPEGNLFEPGTPNTRPEIFVMGCRNPFRIAVDQENGWLYWGDVGPDAGEDNPERGPKGHDGIKLAKTAGNYGWPHTRGNNKPYRDYNFTTKVSGPYFDADHPINDSPNNTGLRELPPARSGLIWYSYDESDEFPWVGTGGKNPMAGPVYHTDRYPAATRMPDYFDGKLIIYEWMRHWFFAVKVDEEGNYIKADPIFQNLEFSRPMDVIVGRDGSIYLLEYGGTWFARNPDARLSRIDYIRGNRGPVAVIAADQNIGGAPLTVSFSAENSIDLDRDKLQYTWWVGPDKLDESGSTMTHTFDYPGSYTVKLKVRDADGEFDLATTEIQVGNTPPVLAWQIKGNQTFWWDGRPLEYQVVMEDAEDGRSTDPGFNTDRISVSIDYLSEGVDITEMAQGHQANMAASRMARGAKLIESSDCKNCHAIDTKVNGPSYQQIAQRYPQDQATADMLAAKIIKGGNGVWGETVMSAHPQLTSEQAQTMAKYILSLDQDARPVQTLPIEQTLRLTQHRGQGDGRGSYVLMATYTDLGNGKIDPITTQDQLVLRSSSLSAADGSLRSTSLQEFTFQGRDLLVGFAPGAYFGFRQIDLTDIGSVELSVSSRDVLSGGKFELRLDAPDGPLAGQGNLPAGTVGMATAPLQLNGPMEGKHDLYFVARNPDSGSLGQFAVTTVRFIPRETTPISMR